MSQVKLIWITPNAEELITYIARVSNPENQIKQETSSEEEKNKMISKLIAYLIKSKHWSPFEMVNVCVEITTTRAISAQIIRHRSFAFQELSQRYRELSNFSFDLPETRYKGTSNRQSSLSFNNSKKNKLTHWVSTGLTKLSIEISTKIYDCLIHLGVAAESARMILPMCSPTRIYMNGTLRSWIHYLQIRDDEHTQLEHQIIAKEIKKIIKENFPLTSKALEWT